MVYIPYNKGGHMSKYKVIFFEENNGKCPIEEFLLNLDIKMRAKLSGLIKVL